VTFKLLTPGLAAALTAAIFVLVAPPASAAAVSRDALERLMLDNCVYRQFQVKEVRRDRLVENCRCASRAAVGALEGDSFDLSRSGGLTGPQEKAVQLGIAGCFKP
jgi:hypothetical protein